ncbi:MAG: RDD family protein [Chloroflexi bacterium]|nr:RDD family protein [Chloroflexota bacterium]
MPSSAVAKSTAVQVQSPPASFPPADVGRRFFAGLVDIVLVNISVLIFGFVLYFMFGHSEPAVVIAPLYYVVLWTLAGTSIGKRLFGLAVVNAEGNPPGWGSSFVRWFVMTVLAVLWITWWPVLASENRRAIHDRLASTFVVERKTDRTAVKLALAGAAALLASVICTFACALFVYVMEGLNASEVPALAPTAAAYATLPAAADSAKKLHWLLVDEMHDNRNYWQLDEGKGYFENDAYHVRSATPDGYFPLCDPACLLQRDLIAEAKFTKVEGRKDYMYGLYFRASEIGGYFFGVADDGGYRLSRWDSQTWHDVIPWTACTFLKPGNQSNTLRVQTEGPVIQLFINGQAVGHTLDSTFQAGSVGVGVTGQGLHVVVNSFLLASIESPTPLAAPSIRVSTVPNLQQAAGQGALIVTNKYDQGMNLSLEGHLYSLDSFSERVIQLAPGQHIYVGNLAGVGNYYGLVQIEQDQNIEMVWGP